MPKKAQFITSLPYNCTGFKTRRVMKRLIYMYFVYQTC